MLCNSIDELRNPAGINARVVIVGAGAVGLHLAKLLADQGRHVVVIESGGTQLAGFEDRSFRIEGREHEGIRIGRNRSLGGTSNLWGGQLVEFQPRDIDGRQWLPGSQWPIRYEELRPHYERTFELLGVPQRFQKDASVWKAVLGKVPSLGPEIDIFLTRWMNVPNLAVLYANDIDRSRSLQVLLNHSAVGFSGNGRVIRGVVVRTPSGQRSKIEAGTIIVAAGTIESVRLLMAAAVDSSWECPWRENRMLGLRFQDHLGGRVAILHPIDLKRVLRLFSTIRWKGQKFQPKLRLSDKRLDREDLLDTTAIVFFESSISEHLIFIKQFLKAAIYSRRMNGVRDFFRHVIASARHLPPLMWAYVREHRVFSPRDSKIVVGIQAEQLPLDSSRLRIDPSILDSNGMPAVILDWNVDGRELVSIRECLVEMDSALRKHGIGRLEIDQRILELDESVLDTFWDTYHASGGCVIGFSPEDGVVDRDLLVFGTDNLYVAGPSTFRTSSDANVTFTAMALATRLSDHLEAIHHDANH